MPYHTSVTPHIYRCHTTRHITHMQTPYHALCHTYVCAISHPMLHHIYIDAIPRVILHICIHHMRRHSTHKHMSYHVVYSTYVSATARVILHICSRHITHTYYSTQTYMPYHTSNIPVTMFGDILPISSKHAGIFLGVPRKPTLFMARIQCLNWV